MVTLTVPNQSPVKDDDAKASAKDEMVTVILSHDVWIEDETAEDRTGVRRLVTNVPVLDSDGKATYDKKTNLPITEKRSYQIPKSLAAKLYAEGKCDKPNPFI